MNVKEQFKKAGKEGEQDYHPSADEFHGTGDLDFEVCTNAF